MVSERLQVDAEILRAQGDLGEFFAGFREMAGGDQIEPFLELPESTTQRTIDLATSLRTPGESTYDTILAYEAWLGANTEYDLDAPVPADGADAVDDFLFESQLGFCEQIASTLDDHAAQPGRTGPARHRLRAGRARPGVGRVERPRQRRPRVGRGVVPADRVGRRSIRPPRCRWRPTPAATRSVAT